MEITGLHHQRLTAPPQKPQGTPQNSPPPSGDDVSLTPPKTPKELFAALKTLGKDAGRDAAARMGGSQKAGYESLIQFQNGDQHVISLTSAAELADYVALVGGPGASSDSSRTHLTALQPLVEQGDRFFLERKGKFLPTDGAGAAVVLARGEAVTRLRRGGEVDEWKAIPAEIPTSSPERSQLGELLDRAEKRDYTFEVLPDPPKEGEKPKKTSMASKLLKGLKSKSNDEVGQRGKLVDALEKGKSVALTLPNDDRKIPLPLEVQGPQLKLFLEYLESPNEEQKSFQEAYAALSKDNNTVLLTRAGEGEAKGMLVQACDRSAYLNLIAGREVVAIAKDGIQYRLNQPAQMMELNSTGKVDRPAGPALDATQASDNLFMVYQVSPFDPIKKGVYDDLLLRMTDVGCSPQVDIVAMHSDLPEKRNLRVDRVQPGKLESLKKMDPEVVMSDPQVFQDFIFETLMANQTDGKVRLFVGGHGGAEKGLLPDGKHNNAEASHAMAVDDFAGAIHLALDRVEKETGKRPFIENLMLCSCLMGNTSLIDALSQTGDVGVLCASPEVMMGSSPNSVIEFLHDPKNSKASGEEFARFLVDSISEAPSAPGGNKESHHADTYGAYRLDKRLARDFQGSLNNLFQVCLERPDQAGAIKRAIAACPTYGVNPFLNLMFDIDNRDVIQVAERILKDARVTSPEIKEACKKVIRDAEAQVIVQKVTENYDGRKGPTIYLPVDRFDFDDKMAQTGFLKGTDYHKFMEMVFDAPLHRGLQDTFLTEVNRFLEAAKEAGEGNPVREAAEKSEKSPSDKTAPADKKNKVGNGKIVKQVHDLEEWRGDSGLARVSRGLRALATGVAAVAGGLAAAAVGAVPGAVVGGLLGLRAGLTGHSVMSERYGVGESTSTDVGHEIKRVARVGLQLGLYPSEAAGLSVHEKVGFRYGGLAASAAGAVAGLVGGAVGGALAGGGLAFLPGFSLTRSAARALTFWTPGAPPTKDHTQGLDSDLTAKE